jgi:hypothetical protein
MSANERAYLTEPDDADFCDRIGCTNDAEPGSILCARHEDDLHEYGSPDCGERA